MSKFKKGDEVICVKNTPDVEEGWIGYVETVYPNDGGVCARNGMSTERHTFYCDELEVITKASVESPSKVKSDGGSSSYYELTITNKNGESIKCETGDVIRSLVGNDFDLGNCVKALRRIYLASIGQGKEGIDVAYDCNKVRYFISEVERVNK